MVFFFACCSQFPVSINLPQIVFIHSIISFFHSAILHFANYNIADWIVAVLQPELVRLSDCLLVHLLSLLNCSSNSIKSSCNHIHLLSSPFSPHFLPDMTARNFRIRIRIRIRVATSIYIFLSVCVCVCYVYVSVAVTVSAFVCIFKTRIRIHITDYKLQIRSMFVIPHLLFVYLFSSHTLQRCKQCKGKYSQQVLVLNKVSLQFI